MNRLPTADRPTSLAETTVFCSLSVAALTLISMAVADGFKFASRQDAIIAALERDLPALPQYAGSRPTNVASTNLHHSSTGGKVPTRSIMSAPED